MKNLIILIFGLFGTTLTYCQDVSDFIPATEIYEYRFYDQKSSEMVSIDSAKVKLFYNNKDNQLPENAIIYKGKIYFFELDNNIIKYYSDNKLIGEFFNKGKDFGKISINNKTVYLATGENTYALSRERKDITQEDIIIYFLYERIKEKGKKNNYNLNLYENDMYGFTSDEQTALNVILIDLTSKKLKNNIFQRKYYTFWGYFFAGIVTVGVLFGS